MLDAKVIRNNPDLVRESLIKRNGDPGLVDNFWSLMKAPQKSGSVGRTEEPAQ